MIVGWAQRAERAGSRRAQGADWCAEVELERNYEAPDAHVRQLLPRLLEIPVLGPVIAGIVLAAWSHRGQIRSEAAFASLAGAAPLPVSSGNAARCRVTQADG